MWTYDPWRRFGSVHVPLVPWASQQELIWTMQDHIKRGQDLGVEKSRETGVSWCALGVLLWFFLCVPDSPFLIGSRTELLVDKRGDPDTLYAKLDYALSWLPAWMRPEQERTHLHLRNLRNGSVIDGASTTAEIGRGGRRSAILLDEAAFFENLDEALSATADVTPCRIFISNPHGEANAFYRLRSSGKTKFLTMPWWQDPRKNKGLYYDEKGKPHSVWYDAEVKRRLTKREVAQELDIDYLTSGSMFFDSDVLARIKSTDVRLPFEIGELAFEYDPEHMRVTPGQFEPDGGKRRLRLWCQLHSETRTPPRDVNYALGCDISAGQGASNSVISIGRVDTGEKVGEFTCPDTMPHELARVAVALAKWFAGQNGHAYIAWESNGPGLIFGKEALTLHYPYVYYQRQEEAATPHAGRTHIPGWHSSRRGKELLLGQYRAALAKSEVINRSEAAVDEAFGYVYLQNGGIGPSQTGEDEESGARATHGDRVMADAVLTLAMSEQPKAKAPEVTNPVGSYGWRQDRARQKRKLEGTW